VADLVICRAGASSLSEIQALGKPSILIPSPNVTENHQYHNAMALVRKNAALIIEEKDLTGAVLTNAVTSLLGDENRLKEIGINARKMAVIDATSRICDIVESIMKK
jgi:UDP-N-acetylglucosamine--N-acetylmuramyl-(pentapeptide) pyrophosphoryl-undecaprenol N-acetylglucosamine transferase